MHLMAVEKTRKSSGFVIIHISKTKFTAVKADANKVLNYSQLTRKRPPLMHDKVVAYGRWSSTIKVMKINLN